MGCESSDVVHLGQDAEVLPLDLLRVDLEVVTHLRITRLPESKHSLPILFARSETEPSGPRTFHEPVLPPTPHSKTLSASVPLPRDLDILRPHGSIPETIDPDMLEARAIEKECGFQQGVVQPSSNDLLPLGPEACGEGVFEEIRVVPPAHEEVRIRGIHPCIEDLLLTDGGTDRPLEKSARDERCSRRTIEDDATLGGPCLQGCT